MRSLLQGREHDLHRVVEILISRETLTGDEFRILLKGGTLAEASTSSGSQESGSDDEDVPGIGGLLRPGGA